MADKDSDDLPVYEPMRVSNAAQRRNPLSDDKRSSRRAQKKEALTLPVQKASAYTKPGYYIIDRYGSPQEGPFDTYSLAIANLNGRDAIQFMDQPQTAPLTEPFPPGMNTVFGSKKEAGAPLRTKLWDMTKDVAGGVADFAGANIGDFAQLRNEHFCPKCHEHLSRDEQNRPDFGVGDRYPHCFNCRPPQTKESKMNREAQLLQAMAKATPSEAKLIMAELEDIRRTARLQRQAEMEWDAAGAVVSEVLTPVATYSRHTAATDWLEDIPGASESVNAEMLTQAALWYQRVPTEVKADREEFLVQAQGVARREASKHGESANDAYALFMDHVSRIHGLSHTANNETLLPWSAVVPPLPPSMPVGDDYNTNHVPGPGNPGQPQPLSNDHAHPGNYPQGVGQAQGQEGAQVDYFWNEADATPEPNDDGALSKGAAQTCPNCAQANMAEKDGKSQCPSCGYSRKTAADYRPGQNPYPSTSIGEPAQREGVPFPNYSVEELANASSRQNLDFWPNADATTEPNDDGAIPADKTDGTLTVGGSRKTASPRFTYEHTSYDEYLNRISAGAAQVSREFYPGSAAASSPSARQTPKVAGGGMAPSRLGGEPQNVDDPTGANLAHNPAAWGDFPEDPHSEQVMKQWGGTSSLPLAPTPGFGSDAVAENWSNISNFPETGPSHVPSERAQNIKANSVMHVAFDEDDDETMKQPEGTQTGGRGNRPGAYQPDRGLKAQSPQGQADSTRGYEDAYSSGRPINWTDTGENVLGTVPVEGYEYNADHPNGEMWPWNPQPIGSGAAAVGDVPTPGVQSQMATGQSWPQPQVTKSSQLQAFRARIAGR